MTIPVSTVPVVKAYLFAQITSAATAATGEQIVVVYDQPSTARPGDIVSVGDVVTRRTEANAMVGSGGQFWLDERYSIEVVVDVFRGGDRAQVVFERAWALAAVVENVVRSDPSLGALVIEAAPNEARTESMWDDKHKGRRCRLSIAVDVYASI